MGCGCGKKKNACGMTPEVVELVNNECPVLFHKTTIQAARGDDSVGSPVAPSNGDYRNMLVEYEANGHKYIYSSDGIFTRIDNDAKDFNELNNRPKYAGVVMTGRTNIPNVNKLRSDMEAADEALIEAISTEASERKDADILLGNSIEAKQNKLIAGDNIEISGNTISATMPTVDATFSGTSEHALQNKTITGALDRNLMTDLSIDPNPSTTSITLNEAKTNLTTNTSTTTTLPLPVASSTQAGVMNSATFNAVSQNSEDINALMNGAVAITNLPASPTQSELTTAWQTETGHTALINRASIYDVTNQKVWTYYTNDTTWYAAANTSQVTVNQFTNSSLGIIKGSTSAGQIFAENDGTGSVNGWDSLTGTVADHTSKLATIEQGAEVNVQSNWNEADNTADSYIQNKPQNLVQDASYVHTDNNFTTAEKNDLAANTSAVSTISPKVTKLDETATRLVATKQITSSKNLNTTEFLQVGNYYCANGATAQTLQNCPVTTAFRMEVNSASNSYGNETTGQYVYRWRKIKNLAGDVYTQVCNSGSTAGTFTYGNWVKEPTMSDLSGKQDTLVSGTNIKTVNSQSLLGSGDVTVGDVYEGNVLSTPTDVAYVDTQNIIDGAVTSSKLDFSTLAFGNYSETEVDTGFTWIDGSHIYKKTINFGALPNATAATKAHGITNLGYVINVDAMSYNGTRWLPLPAASPQTVGASVVLSVGSTNIFIQTGSDRRDDSAYVTLYYTKSS